MYKPTRTKGVTKKTIIDMRCQQNLENRKWVDQNNENSSRLEKAETLVCAGMWQVQQQVMSHEILSRVGMWGIPENVGEEWDCLLGCCNRIPEIRQWTEFYLAPSSRDWKVQDWGCIWGKTSCCIIPCTMDCVYESPWETRRERGWIHSFIRSLLW